MTLNSILSSVQRFGLMPVALASVGDVRLADSDRTIGVDDRLIASSHLPHGLELSCTEFENVDQISAYRRMHEGDDVCGIMFKSAHGTLGVLDYYLGENGKLPVIVIGKPGSFANITNVVYVVGGPRRLPSGIDPLVNQLVNEGHRVIIPILSGMSVTDHPNPDLIRAVRQLEELIGDDALAIRRLVGVSAGGYLAAIASPKSPDLRRVLIAPLMVAPREAIENDRANGLLQTAAHKQQCIRARSGKGNICATGIDLVTSYWGQYYTQPLSNHIRQIAKPEHVLIAVSEEDERSFDRFQSEEVRQMNVRLKTLNFKHVSALQNKTVVNAAVRFLD